MASEDKSIALFEQAGFTDIRTQRLDLSYDLPDPSNWWEVVWNASYRGMINRIPPAQQAQFKREHLDDIARHAVDGRLHVPVEIIYTRGVWC